MAFLRVPRGPKISRQSQNRQKSRKNHSKTDQKMVKKKVKKGQKSAGKWVLGVKKAWSWGSKSAKKCPFWTYGGSKMNKILKTDSKNTAKSYSPKNKIRGF